MLNLSKKDYAVARQNIAKPEQAVAQKAEAAENEVNAMFLLDMPVFSINEAEAIGVVKNIILDPQEKRLLALAVDKRGWYHDVRVIPAVKIRSIGEDVINIDEKQSAQRAVNLPRIVENMHKPCSLVGSRIISDDGHLLGKVERFYLTRNEGRISRLDIGGGLFSGRTCVPAEYIMTIGADAVVVERACLQHLQVTAGVLQVNFAAARERAAGFWQQTVEGTQRLGRGVLQHINEARRSRRAAEELPEELAALTEDITVNL